jgi:hypothetical protein
MKSFWFAASDFSESDFFTFIIHSLINRLQGIHNPFRLKLHKLINIFHVQLHTDKILPQDFLLRSCSIYIRDIVRNSLNIPLLKGFNFCPFNIIDVYLVPDEFWRSCSSHNGFSKLILWAQRVWRRSCCDEFITLRFRMINVRVS